jgi:hypothetical protein
MFQLLFVAIIVASTAGTDLKKTVKSKDVPNEELSKNPGSNSSSQLQGTPHLWKITEDVFSTFNSELAPLTVILFDTDDKSAQWNLRASLLNTISRGWPTVTFAFVNVNEGSGNSYR